MKCTESGRFRINRKTFLIHPYIEDDNIILFILCIYPNKLKSSCDIRINRLFYNSIYVQLSSRNVEWICARTVRYNSLGGRGRGGDNPRRVAGSFSTLKWISGKAEGPVMQLDWKKWEPGIIFLFLQWKLLSHGSSQGGIVFSDLTQWVCRILFTFLSTSKKKLIWKARASVTGA